MAMTVDKKKIKKKKLEITNWQLGLDSMESIEIEIDTDSLVIKWHPWAKINRLLSSFGNSSHIIVFKGVTKM